MLRKPQNTPNVMPTMRSTYQGRTQSRSKERIMVVGRKHIDNESKNLSILAAVKVTTCYLRKMCCCIVRGTYAQGAVLGLSFSFGARRLQSSCQHHPGPRSHDKIPHDVESTFIIQRCLILAISKYTSGTIRASTFVAVLPFALLPVVHSAPSHRPGV